MPLSLGAPAMYLGPGNHVLGLPGVALEEFLSTHLLGGLAIFVKNKSDDFPNQEAKQEVPACPLP